LAEKNQELVKKDKTVADLTKQLSKKDQDLARNRKDLSKKSALLKQTQSALCQAEASLKSQDGESHKKHSRLGDELTQQRKEIANLRETVERFERLFSQSPSVPII